STLSLHDALPISLRVQLEDGNRVRRPVRGQHVGAAEGGGERRQSEPAAQYENARSGEVPRRDRSGERETARPHLRPVWKELLTLERLLVEQRFGAARPEDRHPPAAQLDRVFDEVEFRDQSAGSMFWFTWKTLSGSYFALIFARRS